MINCEVGVVLNNFKTNFHEIASFIGGGGDDKNHLSHST